MPITCRFDPILFKRDRMLTITVEFMVSEAEGRFDKMLQSCGFAPKVEDEDGLIKTKTYKMRYSELVKAFDALPGEDRLGFHSVDEIFSDPGAIYDGAGNEVDQ